MTVLQRTTLGNATIAIFSYGKTWHVGVATPEQIYIESYNTFATAYREYENGILQLLLQPIDILQ